MEPMKVVKRALYLGRRMFRDIPEREKLLVLSLLVGICSGLAAVLLQSLVHFIQHTLTAHTDSRIGSLLYLVLPGVGMLISLIFIKYFIKDNVGHGVTKVLLAVSRNESRIKPHNMYSSVLASSVTIGFGGSVGAEAPIVYTGAAIGSNFARYAGMSYRNVTVLLGCGAAAAVAGIFKAPLAGVLFTLEILLFNISMTSMMPLLLSAVSATMVASIILGHDHPFECTLTEFSMVNIPFYIILGLVCGLCALYFLRTTMWMEDKIAHSRRNTYVKWLLCAIGLGLLIWLFPPLYGEGYGVLSVLLNGGELNLDRSSILSFLLHSPWGLVAFFLLILLLKVFSMTLTNAGGGVGGTFGPTLFIGGIAGFVVSRSLNLILATSPLVVPEQNFVLVGMAGLMAGVMQAPMTAIFLIAEISGGYELYIPLIVTSAISFGTTRLFEKYSIYTKRIAQSGDLITHDNDQSALTMMNIKDLVRDKYPRVHLDDTLGKLAEIYAESTASVISVVDEDGRFQGLVNVDIKKIRNMLFKSDMYDSIHVYNIMETPPAVVFIDEKMESVMMKFDKTEAWRLPVLDSDRKYLGFVSKSRILVAYREEIRELSQD